MIKTIINEGKKVGFSTVEVLQETVSRHEFESFADFQASHRCDTNQAFVRAFWEQGDPVGFSISDPNLKAIRSAFADIYSTYAPVKKKNYASLLPQSTQPVKLNIADEQFEQYSEKTFDELAEKIREILVSFPKLNLIRFYFAKSLIKTYLASTNGLQAKFRKTVFTLTLNVLHQGNFLEISENRVLLGSFEPGKLISRAYNLLNSLVRHPLPSPSFANRLIFSPEAAAFILKEFSEQFKTGHAVPPQWIHYPAILNILDNPVMDLQPGSVPFDDEGVQSSEKFLVRKGEWNMQISDIASGFSRQASSTGNGFRDSRSIFPAIQFTNLYIQPTVLPLQNLMRDAHRGVLISLVKLKSQENQNCLFSAYGYTFENDEIQEPVHLYFRTSFPSFFRTIHKISKEIRFFYSSCNVGSPYLLLEAQPQEDNILKI